MVQDLGHNRAIHHYLSYSNNVPSVFVPKKGPESCARFSGDHLSERPIRAEVGPLCKAIDARCLRHQLLGDSTKSASDRDYKSQGLVTMRIKKGVSHCIVAFHEYLHPSTFPPLTALSIPPTYY